MEKRKANRVYGENNGNYKKIEHRIEMQILNYAAQGLSDYFIHKRLLIIDGVLITRTKIHNIIKKKDKERLENGLERLQHIGLI